MVYSLNPILTHHDIPSSGFPMSDSLTSDLSNFFVECDCDCPPAPIEKAGIIIKDFTGVTFEYFQGQSNQFELLENIRVKLNPRVVKTPLSAWVHITNDCNLACPYCYISKTAGSMTLETGQRSVEAVFRSAIIHGFESVKLKYAGGEATLNFPLVIQLHQYAHQLAKRQGLLLDGVLLSNGVNLSNRMIEALKKHKLRLMISLDGVGDNHDVQRPFRNGHGSFAQVEQTLDRLAAQRLTPSISITISKRNLTGLPDTIAYLLQRKLPFTINFYRVNEASASFTDLAYQDEQIVAAMKEAFVVIEANLPPYSLLGVLTDRARLDVIHDRPCSVGDSYMVINHHGQIAKCQMETDHPLTDVYAEDPLSIIRLDQVGLQNPVVEEKEGCRDCNWRYACAGGCPALTYRVTGRYDIKSPNCRIYQALFPDVLRLEELRQLKYNKTNVL